jgi:hypothetical protein
LSEARVIKAITVFSVLFSFLKSIITPASLELFFFILFIFIK